jgi:molybdate-binding protein/DNA-binding XRE family transcriptional regulator
MPKKCVPEVEKRLSELRQAKDLSAAHLAGIVGVSRQTIYAIEAGSYVPNTVLALRLARALDATVEELFRLPEERAGSDQAEEQATLVPTAEPLQAGQPVQLGRVGTRLIASSPSPIPWYLPQSDAVITKTTATGKKAFVRPLRSDESLGNRILIAGCDPGVSVLARVAQAAGVELVLVHRNSSQSLELLKNQLVHIAGSHLRDEASGESNVPHIGRIFPAKSMAAISFAWWEEGIVTAPGNPKEIRGFADLARRDVSFRNRECGAGARSLLDQKLAALGIDAKKIRGYETTAQGHLHAAWHVATGSADCCIATRGAAQRFGLGFVPIVRERYDFVLRRSDLETSAVQTLFDMVSRSSFRRELASFGYDTSASGERIL